MAKPADGTSPQLRIAMSVSSYKTNDFQMEIKGMTFNQNLRSISWTVIVFSLPIILFVSLLIISYQKVGYFRWGEVASMSVVFFVIISTITVRGLLLHYRYYKQDKGKSLNSDQHILK